ncbi:MAG: pitrilysin family protein [Alphaproteobacteria bacterium]
MSTKVNTEVIVDAGFEIRISTLDNGLRVVSQSMTTVDTVSLGAWVDAGARNESRDINGISHLLEHMAFKGTKRRDAYTIAAEIEAVGGHLNAYTSREQTAFFAKILKDDLALATDLLGDILCQSTFEPGELAREKDVIIQEIGQANDTPDDIVFDHFQETAYPDQPVGRPVLGSAEGVAALERGALFDYLGIHYTAPDMVFAAAGRLDHDHLLGLAEDAFGDLPATRSPAIETARYKGGDFRHDRDLEQLHLLIGVDGLAYEDDDIAALQVLSTVLGGGMSSRLFQEVREKRGLAYSVFTFASSFVDGGVFGVYAGTGPDESGALAGVICDELKRVLDGVTAEEIARSKAQLKSGLLMSLESNFSRCEQVARQMLIYGRPKTVDEIIEKIDAVDETAVLRCMTRLLEDCTPTVAALGPTGDLPDFETISAALN